MTEINETNNTSGCDQSLATVHGSRLEAVEAGISSFISMCNAACEARNKTCRSYLDRHRRCPECPKDWAKELKEHVEDEVRKLFENGKSKHE